MIVNGYEIKPGADLQGAYIPGANLAGANLAGANLEGANLRGADLEGADLQGANLVGANLEGANLTWADLRESNLVGANLVGANLEGTCLDPQALPNGDTEGFEIAAGGVVGYRTQAQIVMRGKDYQIGQVYRAPWFSVADTPCHPGLYICPSIRMLQIQHREATFSPIIKVLSRPEDVHKAGNKWRTRAFRVLEVV